MPHTESSADKTNKNATHEPPTLLLAPEYHPDRMIVPKAKLLVVSGPRQGQEYVIDKESFALGSDPRNDLVLQDSTVSRHHCEIRLVPDGYVIRDLGSTNGTRVQGVRVTEAFMDHGTEFQLGKTKIVFCPLPESMEYTLSQSESFGFLLGKSVAMRRVFHIAETYAPTDATILIEGETGTGKEVLAEEIHKHSSRKDKPFVVIDCATLAKELIESELFGHVKGAYTGANTDRVGAFEHADGGTVFLDEISDLSMDLQPKLLRVLEKREIRRIGSNQVRGINVRIISATNRKLENEINSGKFREDLYYRLSVVHIALPPLRKRKDDIPLLTARFLRDFHGPDALQQVVDFDKTMEIFKKHEWPGNVRELRNLVEIASYSEKRPLNLGACIYLGKMKRAGGGQVREYAADMPFKTAKNQLISDFEKEYLRTILERFGGNISRAAREAKIERAYLQRLIKKYDLKP